MLRRASQAVRSNLRKGRLGGIRAAASTSRKMGAFCTKVAAAASRPVVPTFKMADSAMLRTYSSGQKMYGNGVIGIVREVYSIWERRVPLTPVHVRELVKKGLRVLVQPSERRIFTDEEYRKAGAEVTDDLSPAGTIIGVKQVQKEKLLPDRTYMFFSHTIKAQPENMPLLDEIINKNVRLVDYECIVDPATNKRLVAFGEYAGYAGMIDILRGIGGQFLGKGFGTPFLNVGSTYMYDDLAQAKEAVIKLGEKIRTDGLPNALSPLTFVFTGNGKVSRGAQEIFNLLPHRWVSPEEMVKIAKGEVPADNKTLYATVVGVKDIVRPNASAPDEVKTLTGRDYIDYYYKNPEHFEASYHDILAPYTSVLVNCMYWDMRYPRLLSIENMKDLSRKDGPMAEKKAESGLYTRPFAVSDITCDIGGSIEFNFGATLPEDPFFMYNPLGASLTGREEDNVSKEMSSDGVLVGAVDILPSELPKDASQHFSNALFPFMEKVAKAGTVSDLPAEVRVAAITQDEGALSPAYMHIQRKRELESQVKTREMDDVLADPRQSKVLRVRGHLFDSNLINTLLSYIEDSKLAFKILDVDVGLARDQKTSVLVQVLGHEEEGDSKGVEERIEECVQNLSGLVQSMGPVAGNPSLSVYNFDPKRFSPQAIAHFKSKESSTQQERAKVKDMSPQKVTIFGAGRMVGPVIRYLQKSRKGGVGADERPVYITLADVDPNAAQEMCRAVRPSGPDAEALLKGSDIVPVLHSVSAADRAAMEGLVQESDAVVSLVPAQFHADIARLCVDKQTNMVTASYVSDDMAGLDSQARASGITIVNEVGVDPGIDHMSALALIEDIKKSGGRIESFYSICGGLPAPEAADNPLGYKFSWSPRGVLIAGTNDATYLKDGEVVRVEGKDLYASATPAPLPFPGNPSLALEFIPNRNSLPYKEMYGLQDAHTVMRGTYRYRGYCDLLMAFTKLGLIDFASSPLQSASWAQQLAELTQGSTSNLSSAITSHLTTAGVSEPTARRAIAALEWLGTMSPHTPVASTPSIADGFCSLLESKLQFQPGEKDILVMNHECVVSYPDEPGRAKQLFRSQLVKYGDNDCVGGEGETAMARLVGVPTAIATDLLLRGVIPSGNGVIRPMQPSVYLPMLSALKQEGIECVETAETLY
eukprot:CAMPEP_0113892702 /NCGR_PEP_ID=MMETSP0780_2-20120614/15591_1 /TAXON_ID=652834 /ORGANISM="Palpitomonas bilix" /LENGTH=1157 /DNA_ID=CAMNT_0000882725 /DNA_START=88 /DNA_END=3561 /DNA_ORIENTATION=+ /assembly_acc=CAM_ASM_000599